MFKRLQVSAIAFALLTVPSVPFAQGNAPQSFPPPRVAGSESVQAEWVRQYVSGFSPQADIPYAIAVDASGNACVTGGSWGPDQLPDMTTIKYDSAGDTLWVRRHNGPGDSWDQGMALALDAAGNVYVTGRTYSQATCFDYVTLKYDASGVQQWVAYYDSSDDTAIAIAVDASGNVYVSGYSGGPGTFYDYATIKYNSLGQEQWVARYNGPGNTKDIASGLGIDASGNVYVTGSSGEGSPNLSDYVTVKYNSAGIQQWVARYSDLYDYATAIGVDASANVYVTGYSYGSGTFYDYATVKYNAMGVQQWVRRYNGPGTSDDLAYALKVDGSGNVFVTGEAFYESATGTDYATIKYSPSGVEQWVRRYNGPGNAVDIAYAIALDESGDAYVTGASRGENLVDDFATIKYSASGDEQWAVRHGPDSEEGEVYYLATAIAVDASGGVNVTGYSSQIGSKRYTTIKYSQNDVTGIEAPEPVRRLALVSPNPVLVGGLVTLRGTETAPVEVFGPDGRRILKLDGNTGFRASSPGVFLVRAGGQTQKLVVIGKSAGQANE